MIKREIPKNNINRKKINYDLSKKVTLVYRSDFFFAFLLNLVKKVL